MVSTTQDVFDTIVQHLRTQRVRAVDPVTGECRYRLRTDAGQILRCAAGCLVPDALYDPRMEGVSVILDFGDPGAVMHRIFGQLLSTPEQWQLVRACQIVHDSGTLSPTEWESRLQRIASEFGLRWTPCV